MEQLEKSNKISNKTNLGHVLQSTQQTSFPTISECQWIKDNSLRAIFMDLSKAFDIYYPVVYSSFNYWNYLLFLLHFNDSSECLSVCAIC